MYHNVSKEKLKKIMNSKKQKKKVDKGSIKDIKMNEDGFLEVEKKKRPKKINIDKEFDIKKN
jgi:hypothetical protein|tara:strand:- start:1872 stop:2057 length:186 start_codon:yes stop_codon:yes gene_type:complete